MNQLMLKQFFGSLWDSLTQPIQDWLLAHPYGNWLLMHPLWAIGLVLIVLLLLSGLFGAIAQLTQRLWIALLQFPVLLTRWIFVGTFQLGRAIFQLKPAPAPTADTQQQRLAEILDRLEVLKQEQDELLQEVKQILAVKEIV
ncbi:hypothetical protein IFO70_14825 [Phormidium tenue FACHB-886]|nr:hypothetical protein [Phormidium tenue FACHB-886]